MIDFGATDVSNLRDRRMQAMVEEWTTEALAQGALPVVLVSLRPGDNAVIFSCLDRTPDDILETVLETALLHLRRDREGEGDG